MEESKEILACEDHVDMAMEDIINEKEAFPNMDSVEIGKCNYCNNNAKYKVK